MVPCTEPRVFSLRALDTPSAEAVKLPVRNPLARQALTVKLFAFQAVVKDAHPAVGQLAGGLVVSLASGPELVVVVPCTRRAGERAKGPPIEGIAQPSVSGKAGEDHPAAPEALVTGDVPP